MSPRQISILSSFPEETWPTKPSNRGLQYEQDHGILASYAPLTDAAEDRARVFRLRSASSSGNRTTGDLLRPRSVEAGRNPVINRPARAKSTSPTCTTGAPEAHTGTGRQEPSRSGDRRSMIIPAQEYTGRANNFEPSLYRSRIKQKQRPDTLGFPTTDLVSVTGDETMQRVMAKPSAWQTSSHPESPVQSRSSTQSSPSEFRQSTSGAYDRARPLHSSDTATSPNSSASGDKIGTGSPTPRPTQTGDGELQMPVYSTNPIAPVEMQGHWPLHFSAQAPASAPQTNPAYRYGTPEMPRGKANLPHLPAGALLGNPRGNTTGHVKHLPRAEKLPLTGYDLLASKLSAHVSGPKRQRRDSIGASSIMSSRSNRSSGSGLPKLDRPTARTSGADMSVDDIQITPLYRKFEALNHRLLLHLQDELSELEEQLRRLDTADTQRRRLQSHIMPASRRAEYSSGGELQWQKSDILGKICFKLGQYNQALSSFTETQRLPPPPMADVETYRNYLATQQPITETETRFLDAAEDLVSLHPGSQQFPSRDESASPSSPSFLQSLADNTRPTGRRTIMRSLDISPLKPFFSPQNSVQSSRPASVCQQEVRTPKLDGDCPGARHHLLSTIQISSPRTTAILAPTPGARELPKLITALAAAVVLPILSFLAVHGFMARMTVVVLIAGTAFSSQLKAGAVCINTDDATKQTTATVDMLLCAGAYGAAMAIIAGIS